MGCLHPGGTHTYASMLRSKDEDGCSNWRLCSMGEERTASLQGLKGVLVCRAWDGRRGGGGGALHLLGCVCPKRDAFNLMRMKQAGFWHWQAAVLLC